MEGDHQVSRDEGDPGVELFVREELPHTHDDSCCHRVQARIRVISILALIVYHLHVELISCHEVAKSPQEQVREPRCHAHKRH